MSEHQPNNAGQSAPVFGTEIQTLCARLGLASLQLFGSAAEGRFDRDWSDLDFLYRFRDPKRPDYADAFFALKEALEDMVQRKVDLVAEQAIKNPYFRAERA